MKILMMHANYRVLGGEDVSHATERSFLSHSGHQVLDYSSQNSRFADLQMLQQFSRTIYNREARLEVEALLGAFEPDVVYANNTFPSLSPSVLHAATSRRIPVVQVLRNYRQGCIAGTTFRDGKPCELCIGKPVGVPGVVHRCFRGSIAASTAATVARTTQRILGLHDSADAYIAVSQHVRDIAIRSGVSHEKIRVRHNLVWPDPGVQTAASNPARGPFVFVGRETQEKGLSTLLSAVSSSLDSDLHLEVYGCSEPEGFRDERVRFNGSVTPSRVLDAMRGALAVIVPSVWPEPFGRVVIEALSVGTPVIASDVGGMADLSGPGVTLVPPGSSTALLEAMVAARSMASDRLLDSSNRARKQFEDSFSPGRWLSETEDILTSAVEGRASKYDARSDE